MIHKLIFLALVICFIGNAQAAANLKSHTCDEVYYKFSSPINLGEFEKVFGKAKREFIRKEYGSAATILDAYSGSASILLKLLSNGIKRTYIDEIKYDQYVSIPGWRETYRSDPFMAIIEAIYLSNGLLFLDSHYEDDLYIDSYYLGGKPRTDLNGIKATKYFTNKWMSDANPDHVLYAARINYVWSTKSFRPDSTPAFRTGYIRLRILSEEYRLKYADRYVPILRKRLDDIHRQMPLQEREEREKDIKALYQFYKACFKGPIVKEVN